MPSRAKVLAILFALTTIAFCVATIVLVVEKRHLKSELQDALNAFTSATAADDVTAATVEVATESSSYGPLNFTTITTTTTHNTPVLPTLPAGLPDPEKILHRLPTDLRPIVYRIYWRPDLKRRTCDGSVSVQVEVEKETNVIAMNAAKDMRIHGISIHNMMARMRIRMKKFYLSVERELLIIELHELLRVSTPYTISISYSLSLDGLDGMYVSSYRGTNGETRQVLLQEVKFEV